jgi:hypothetical protein
MSLKNAELCGWGAYAYIAFLSSYGRMAFWLDLFAFMSHTAILTVPGWINWQALCIASSEHCSGILLLQNKAPTSWESQYSGLGGPLMPPYCLKSQKNTSRFRCIFQLIFFAWYNSNKFCGMHGFFEILPFIPAYVIDVQSLKVILRPQPSRLGLI